LVLICGTDVRGRSGRSQYMPRNAEHENIIMII
jgi:hypothetical protein